MSAPNGGSPEQRVLLTVEGTVARVTLNDPDRLNALTARAFTELAAIVEHLAGREDVHCTVLEGAGRSFCSGHALETLDDPAELDPSAHRHEQETIDALEALPMPTIAALQGHCLTGGLELALACDLLIAADNAILGDTHSRLGLVPVWGMSVRLPERVGRSKAKELSFTGRRISGREAAAIGLVDRAVPADELGSTVQDLAAEIAANSPGSNRIYKALYDDAPVSRRAGLDREHSLELGFPADMAERLAGLLGRSDR